MIKHRHLFVSVVNGRREVKCAIQSDRPAASRFDAQNVAELHWGLPIGSLDECQVEYVRVEEPAYVRA